MKTLLVTHPATRIDHAATGEAVRAKRVKSGKALRAVARQLKISAAFLCDLEHGRRNWTPELIARVEAVL